MTVQKSVPPRAWIDLAVLSLLWGGSFLSVRIALDEIGPITSVAHRVTWAAIALWIWILFRRLPVPRSPRIWGAFLVMGLLNNVIPFNLIAWGQLHIETGLASILNAATAFLGALVAALAFHDERLTPRRLIGVGLGTVGVATAIGLGTLLSFDIRSVGQLAVLGAALSYAFAAAWARARLGGLRPEVAAACMLTASALISLPMARIAEGPIDLTLRPATLAAIGYYALAATAIAYLLYYRIVAAAGAANTMLTTLMIPPVAILLGALARGEALAPRAFAGFALIALGLLVLNGTIGHRRRLSSDRRDG